MVMHCRWLARKRALLLEARAKDQEAAPHMRIDHVPTAQLSGRRPASISARRGSRNGGSAR